MPVFCAVYECSNRPNRDNTSFQRVGTCVVHKGKSQEIDWKKWLVNLRLRSTGAGVPQQWCHMQTTYWMELHAVRWWRLRQFSLQKVSRQRGTSHGYPLCQWNGNLLAARGSITSRVACTRACILIGGMWLKKNELRDSFSRACAPSYRFCKGISSPVSSLRVFRVVRLSHD